MANVSDKSILTAAGKALLAQLNAEEKALVIDKMIFANVPNRPEYPQPDDVVPADNVVHQAAVEQRGRLSEDSVIYSTTLASNEGPFEFNWTGAYCSEYGVLVTIDHHSMTPKTVDEPGVSGNTLVRSVVLEYKDIAEITNITVDASTWQYNATPRMKKMDNDVAQANIDQNGKDWFIEEGFLVTPQASAFSIKAGAGYVSGNRVTLEFDRNVQVPNKPSFIYVDAHREGTPTGEQITLFDFVVTAEEKDDYANANGVKHFVCKVAQVLADGSVSDLRPEGDSAGKEWVITKQRDDKKFLLGGDCHYKNDHDNLDVGEVLPALTKFSLINGAICQIESPPSEDEVVTSIDEDEIFWDGGKTKFYPNTGGYYRLNTATAVIRSLFDRITETISIKDFGAKVDGETDDTEAVCKALMYSYLNAPQNGWRLNTIRIKSPRGVVRIAQPNRLFQDTQAGSFFIEGDGPGQSVWQFDVPETVESEWMIKNVGKFGFTKFKGLSFSSKNENGQFLQLGGTGSEQSIEFESCDFLPFDLLVESTGGVMNSEMSYHFCSIKNFKEGQKIFKLANPQAVNWRFYGTDIENFSCELFTYLAGATVLFIQGSIIPTGNGCIVHVPEEADGNLSGAGNTPSLNCIGTRFEMRGNSKVYKKENHSFFTWIIFDGVGMGGMNIEDNSRPMFDYVGQGKFTLINCTNIEKYWIKYSNKGSTVWSSSWRICGTSLPADFITRSEITLTDATYNVNRYPYFSIRDAGHRLDGDYFARGYSESKGQCVHKKVSFNSERQVLARGVGLFEEKVVLPPTVICGIELMMLTNTTYHNCNQTVVVMDSNRTVLGELTYNTNQKASLEIKPYVEIGFVQDVDDFLIFEFSSDWYNQDQAVKYLGYLNISG